ncbi:hypothetical protein BGZ88_012565 [Linnemannia elongata]|nr:hypothetical protein BGZ88_012565 [Linnemannia elongata]
MPHYINTIPQSHKAQHLAHTSYSHLIDGPIAKGGGGGRGGGGGGRGGGGSSGGGSRGGSRGGGGGSSGGGSSGGGSSGGGYYPGVPPIILIPGSGGGYRGHGSSSNSTAPYDSSSSKNTGAIVGGVLGAIAVITFIFLFGCCCYKRRQAKEQVEDAEAQDKELGGALGPDGVAPFTLYSPPPPPFTPTDPSATATTPPDYIATKSPLEYYRQIPSSSENLASAATASSSSPRLVPTLTPYSQDQYQQPRIATQGLRRPSSPAISPITATNPEGLRSYTPPPRTTPMATTGEFYDHLDVSSDSGSSVPPAVPQDTRPDVTKPASFEKLTS